MDGVIENQMKKPNNYIYMTNSTFFDNKYCKLTQVMDSRDSKTYFYIEYYKIPTDEQKKDFCWEISFLKSCNSDHILKYHDSFYTEHYRVLVIELCSDAQLSEILNDIFSNKMPPLLEKDALNFMRQIISGFNELHRVGGMHGSFTPLSVVKKDKNYKIFGLGAIKTHAFEGKYDRYIAPEARKSKEKNFDSDIWSLGVMLFEMLAGQPYDEALGLEQIEKLTRISKETKGILKKMLNKNISERVQWEELKKYFKIISFGNPSSSKEFSIRNSAFNSSSSIYNSIHPDPEIYLRNLESAGIHSDITFFNYL